MEQKFTHEQIEHIKKWIINLRSGKFKQGDGVLVKYDLYSNRYLCCMGVLLETNREICPCSLGPNGYLYEPEGAQFGLNLPMDQLFLKNQGWKLETPPNLEDVLANWNDTLGLSFYEIADNLEDLIEGKWPRWIDRTTGEKKER